VDAPGALILLDAGRVTGDKRLDNLE